ncbi:MAG: putative serine esterase-domain-containing protein [Linnemannia elongata]|nr:MAG: putative serine esterase-domain-containing protein [Linnemannia elongata]
MTQKPVLAVSHKVALSVGGIIRYRLKLLPSQAKNIDKLQFRIRNSAPIYRNITPSSGPWKIAVALVRTPDKLPVVPELVPSIGCGQVCRLDASVDHNHDDDEDEGYNEWELEVLSEMILQHNWIDIKVEIYVVPRTDSITPLEATTTASDNNLGAEGTDTEIQPRVLLPTVLSCDYKDTQAICGPARPEDVLQAGDEEGVHLVLLTHGIHGSWLDMLYIKERIDAHNKDNGKTITFLTDTNHAGTEEGIQMAGQRVAMDILEWTGYCDTEQGEQLRKAFSPAASKSITATAATTSKQNKTTAKPFPRGISKVSIIGHSLGGLINVYALGFIEELTQGVFFRTIQPAHFITLASPLLGVGFEHPWVLGYALSLGVIGQTGKDLALESRSSKLKRSPSSASSGTSLSTTSTLTSDKHLPTTPTSTPAPGLTMECALDKGSEPLLLAMARPGSASNRVLKQFVNRTSYANIENDMAVKFNTSSMMGIPSFDMDQFFSPEGAATQPKKSIYHSALVSVLALLLPQIPPRTKFLGIADAPSPVVIVERVEAGSVEKLDGAIETQDATTTTIAATTAVNAKETKKNKKIKKSGSVKSAASSNQSISRSSSGLSSDTSSRSFSPSSASDDVSTMSRLDLARLVSEGYHTGMDWTKIGVFIEHEAHVQIIVRRKWYNLDGWKCVQDLVERFDFS